MKYKKMNRKPTQTYYISVEGETEKWYFEHLRNLINDREERTQNVKFNIKVERRLESAAKTFVSLFATDCFHIFDFEGTSKNDEASFENVINDYKAMKNKHSNLKYKLGYSNLTFEIWMILHRKKLSSHISNKKTYLSHINKVFSKNFNSLDDYKSERNFKAILNDYIGLDEVIIAIKNAESIREKKIRDKVKIQKIGKFSYFMDNPDCTIHECVKQILLESGIKIS